ncbi:hypothetical protein SAMN04487995_1387 [Dyadobacter koreensis]|uniref:GDSL-like Lipase/Acylhydrolase n=1 Tax=Dyadobacter koreensis TaxID=408657 RepID=A0A1H6RL47_9BACT|nr:hypothetical protein [Dyadobacter koreensis]SEI56521.1 hypothetical protein SAMN04487995_1387 [Dyadobacter koreensis]
MKKNYTFFILLVAPIFFLSCNKNTDSLSPYTNIDNPLKAGEILIPVKADPSFAWAPAAGSVNLGDLEITGSSEPFMIAIGDANAAGYRDGGLYRQGQLTSYPNLVARQMGLTNFKQPLFDKEYGNGTGYLVRERSSAMPFFQEVTNNTAWTERGSVYLKPYNGTAVNNFAIPGSGNNIFHLNPGQELAAYVDYYKHNPKPADFSNVNYLWVNQRLNASLANRFAGNGKESLNDYLKTIRPDLALVESGLDVFISANINGGNGYPYGGSEFTWELYIHNYLKEKGTKYVYATVPDVIDFPYFHWFNYDQLMKKSGKAIGVKADDSDHSMAATPESLFLPTANVANIFNKTFKNPHLMDSDVIRKTEIARPNFYNDLLVRWSKEYNYAVVDFYSVYKKIIAGKYISEDGFKIDPSYPNGNFFSADGIYPTAIGQAVLANEVIKVLNTTHHAQIPLINITRYANEMDQVK